MRQHKCNNCGSIFLAEKEGVYLCPKCADESRRKSVLRERVCTRCGTTYMGYPASKYCPDCRIEVERERNRKHKRNGSARKIGSIDLCEKCGKEYIITGGLQKYCPECAKEAVQEKIRARKRKYMESYNRDVRPVIRAERKENGTVCVVCGKTFTTTTPTVTCSPECAKEQKRRLQAIYDYKRGEGNVESFIKPKTEKK